jgi:hypothetical protein
LLLLDYPVYTKRRKIFLNKKQSQNLKKIQTPNTK